VNLIKKIIAFLLSKKPQAPAGVTYPGDDMRGDQGQALNAPPPPPAPPKTESPGTGRVTFLRPPK
jgi:hypothetical protein